MGRRTVGLLTPQRLWLVPVVGLLGSVLAWYRLVQEHHGGDEGGSSGSAVSGDKGPQLWWLREKPPAWQRAVSNFTSHGTDSAWLTVVYLSLVATQAFVLRLCWAYRRFWPLHFALPLAALSTLALASIGLGYDDARAAVLVRAFHNNIIFGTCVLLNLLSIATSVAFRIPGIPDSTGRFSTSRRYFEYTNKQDVTVSGCIFYPCGNPMGQSAYAPLRELNPRAFISFGAPRVIRRCFFFLLDHWVYERVHTSEDDSLPSGHRGTYPVVIFSHGNGAYATLYTAVLTAIASHGYVCVALDHMDGSAGVLRRRRQGVRFYDFGSYGLFDSGSDEYKRGRRLQLETRYEEMHAAHDFVYHLHTQDLVFRGQLDMDHILLAGHSFGGATALTAAMRWQHTPRCPQAVMVFDPAVDWMPDTERRTLLSARAPDVLRPPTFVLYSSRWRETGDGAYGHLASLFGPAAMANHPQPRHHVATLPYSTHYTFSDTVFMVPLWVLRLLGFVRKGSDPFFLHAAQDTMVSTWLSHFPNHPA